MPWPCFWVEPSGRQARWLRRYRGSDLGTCPLTGAYHDRQVRVEDGPDEIVERHGHRGRWAPEPALYRDDLRWPTCCRCGYVFVAEDPAQIYVDTIYRSGEGREWAMRDLPIGALLDADWHHGSARWCGADGRSLMVKLPPGGSHEWWLIDGPSSSGGRWARSGEPPQITVTPSILTPRYHGFLQAGTLTDPL